MFRTSFGITAGTIIVLAAVVQAAPPRGVNLGDLQSWDIVVSRSPSTSERYAANEFRDLLAEACGFKLPVVKRVDRLERHIFIGASDAMRASKVGFSTNQMGPEDLRIVARDRNIAIAGGEPRGTLYGVYTFLEDYVGVRFLDPKVTHVPPMRSWHVIGPVDRYYHPPLSYRWSCYGQTNNHPEFAVRLRCNTVSKRSKYGGSTSMVRVDHTFEELLPATKYGKDHPEYFCMIDKKRQPVLRGGSQPCLTNPQVLKIVTNAVLAQIKADPDLAVVQVAQNDNDNYCRCGPCKAINSREGTPMGSLLDFVNRVADAVARQHPHIKVGTLAYWYSEDPPRSMRARPNVVIQLAPVGMSVIRPFNDPDSKLNTDFPYKLQTWSNISSQLNLSASNVMLSDYWLPCPNLRAIGPNIRYLVSQRVGAVFMQGAWDTEDAEFAELRNYVTSRLLWNPSLDDEQLIDEFLRLYYGRAAAPLKRLIDYANDQVKTRQLDAWPYAKGPDYGVDEELAKLALECFEQAVAAADDAEVRRRVEKQSIIAYRAMVEQAWLIRDKSKLSSDDAKRLRPYAKRLFELAKQYLGYDAVWRERLTFREAERMIKPAFNLAADQPW